VGFPHDEEDFNFTGRFNALKAEQDEQLQGKARANR